MLVFSVFRKWSDRSVAYGYAKYCDQTANLVGT
jgi:hypothetical protein